MSICEKCKSALGHIVKTPYGDFKLSRSKTQSISVLKLTREIIHFGKIYNKGEYMIIHHKTIPDNIVYHIMSCKFWGEYVATYDLNGKEINYLDRNIKSRIKRLEEENEKLKAEIENLKGSGQ